MASKFAATVPQVEASGGDFSERADGEASVSLEFHRCRVHVDGSNATCSELPKFGPSLRLARLAAPNPGWTGLEGRSNLVSCHCVLGLGCINPTNCQLCIQYPVSIHYTVLAGVDYKVFALAYEIKLNIYKRNNKNGVVENDHVSSTQFCGLAFHIG